MDAQVNEKCRGPTLFLPSAGTTDGAGRHVGGAVRSVTHAQRTRSKKSMIKRCKVKQRTTSAKSPGPIVGRGLECITMASVRPRRECVTLPSMSSMCPTLVHIADIELSRVATALRISLKSAVTDEWKE